MGAWWFFQTSPQTEATTPAAQPHGLSLPRAPSLLAAGSQAVDTATAAATPLQAHSLGGTEADGDWAIGQSGLPQPHTSLRRRFDYYLTLQGETPLDQVAAHIRAQVHAAHGPAAAQQLMDLWARYLRLQQHPWATQVDLQRPETWGAVLAERSAVRRQLLGTAWADAFYRAEEDELRALMAQTPADTIAPSPTPLPDSAQREAQVQAQWEQWSQRIDAARAYVQQLRQAPELSAVQRSAAIDTYLNQQFSGTELLRAKALLQI